jgi:hypothetical protein
MRPYLPVGYRSALLELVYGGGGDARHIVGKQIIRGGRHPVFESDLLELSGVPGLDDLQVLVAGVEDRVPVARREVSGDTRLDLGHLAAAARSERSSAPVDSLSR